MVVEDVRRGVRSEVQALAHRWLWPNCSGRIAVTTSSVYSGRCRHNVMDFVAFEKGRGGPRQSRPPAAALLEEWNRALASAQSGIRFRSSVRGTGNYVLSSSDRQSAASVSGALQQTLRQKFAVFTVEEFLSWFAALEHDLADPPQVSVTRRPNQGAVMDLNPAADVPGPLPAPSPPRNVEAWTSGHFAVRRVREVWKNDLLRAPGRLDSTRREGTWGALSRAMERAYGGDWTARAIGTLKGVARRAQDRPPDGTSIRAPARSSGVSDARGDAVAGHDVSTLLRSVTQPPAISHALGTLLDTYDAGASAIHIVVQARRIAEVLARETCRAHGLDVAGRQLVDLCRDIASRGLLPDKHQAYLHVLRKLGNFAAHEAQEGDVNGPDVEAALWMLFALATAHRGVTTPSAMSSDVSGLRRVLDDPEIVRLYGELAEDDLLLAEEGMAEYRRQLNAADGR